MVAQRPEPGAGDAPADGPELGPPRLDPRPEVARSGGPLDPADGRRGARPASTAPCRSADLAGRDVPDGVDDAEMRPDPQPIGPSLGCGGRREGPIQGVTREALWLGQRSRYPF